jgi:hypothetical protein
MCCFWHGLLESLCCVDIALCVCMVCYCCRVVLTLLFVCAWVANVRWCPTGLCGFAHTHTHTPPPTKTDFMAEGGGWFVALLA